MCIYINTYIHTQQRVCMCVCACVCARAPACVCVYDLLARVCVCVRAYFLYTHTTDSRRSEGAVCFNLHECVCMCVRVCVYLFIIYTYVCSCACVCMCVRVRVYVCIIYTYVCPCACVCIYYIHTQQTADAVKARCASLDLICSHAYAAAAGRSPVCRDSSIRVTFLSHRRDSFIRVTCLSFIYHILRSCDVTRVYVRNDVLVCVV